MVDNKEQWEDIEYTDDAGNGSSYDTSDFDEENTYQDQEYEDYDDDDMDEPKKKKGSSLPLLLLFLILIGAIAFLLVTKFGVGKPQQNVAANNSMPAVEQQTDNVLSTEDMANSFFNEAGGDNSDMMSVNFNDNGETNVTDGEGDIVATVSEPDAETVIGDSDADLFVGETNASDSVKAQENNAIMVSYNKIANINPFKPPVIKEVDTPYELINDTQFEIIEPPVTSVPDENLTRLLQTQISGILYDEESPSAIVNLNGIDQFVKIGDTVSGYTIKDITRNKVQISYKNNSYVAAVGELFTRGALEKKQAVDNLENKFAGRYKNNNN